MKRKAQARQHLTACPITGLPIKALTPKKLNSSNGVTAKTLANTLKNQLGYDDALEGLSKDQLIEQYCFALQKHLLAPAASPHGDRTARSRSPAPAVSGRSPTASQRQSLSAAAQATGGAGTPSRTVALPAPARAGASLSQSRSAAAQATGGVGAPTRTVAIPAPARLSSTLMLVAAGVVVLLIVMCMNWHMSLEDEIRSVHSMTVAEIKRELSQRGLATDDMFEKEEFVRRLAQARLDKVPRSTEEERKRKAEERKRKAEEDRKTAEAARKNAAEEAQREEERKRAVAEAEERKKAEEERKRKVEERKRKYQMCSSALQCTSAQPHCCAGRCVCDRGCSVENSADCKQRGLCNDESDIPSVCSGAEEDHKTPVVVEVGVVSTIVVIPVIMNVFLHRTQVVRLSGFPCIIIPGAVVVINDWQYCTWPRFVHQPPAWPMRRELLILWVVSGAVFHHSVGMRKRNSFAIFPAHMFLTMFLVGMVTLLTVLAVLMVVAIVILSVKEADRAAGSPPASAPLSPRGSLSHQQIAPASARNATGNPSHSPKVVTCSVAGCSRIAWNGQPGEQCCRNCHNSNGRRHGPVCDQKAGHPQSSPAPRVDGAAPARPAVPSAAPAGLSAGFPGSPDSPAGGRKRKLTVDHDADDLRPRWASPGQAGKERKKLFDVDGGCQEFQEVQKQFMATMAGKATIQRIQRVENGHQYEAFLQQKETITEEIADLGVHCSNVVRLLFHGTKKDSTHDIIHGKTAGFEPLASGARTGAIWGHGAYFARDAAYSHNLTELASGERQMMLNQVLVGLSTKGEPKINLYPKVQVPGASNQSSRYHSLVDNPQSPTIFVVAHSNQAYPAYLITYR
jgi:hypothetical protein